MKIYAIKIEYYNDLESYVHFWIFEDSLSAIKERLFILRHSEFSSAKFTKYTFNATQVDEMW